MAPASSPLASTSFSRSRWLALVTAAFCLAFLGACGSSGTDKPVVNSVPETTEAPATQSPQSSDEQNGQSGRKSDNGAEPGRDSGEVDPPGGTTPTPNPGGFSDGDTGQGVNPDTDHG